jgi:hypothetical protein
MDGGMPKAGGELATFQLKLDGVLWLPFSAAASWPQEDEPSNFILIMY